MKNIFSLVTLLACLFALVTPAYAQSATLELRLGRDFGYSDGSGTIQGTFSLTASGPEELTRVTFLIDGEQLGEDAEAPFKLQFITDSYPKGIHTLTAVGVLADGSQMQSNEIKALFITAEESGQKVFGIIVPVLAAVFGVMILGFAITMISNRRKGAIPLGAPRNYTVFGGTICPKCKRPFAFHILKFNLGLGALDFCPHCGKWSLLRSLPIDQLRAAEAAELEWSKEGNGQVKGMTEEEKLRKELDDSRFQ